MNGEIIVGIITAASVVICQIIIAMTGRRSAQAERAESQQLLIYRLEQDSEVLKEKISVANHRIDDL